MEENRPPTFFQRVVIWIPILYSIFYSLANYLYAQSIYDELSYQGQLIIREQGTQIFLNGLLILFPNIILSILLWFYRKYRPDLDAALLIPCLVSIGAGTLLALFFFEAHQDLGGTNQVDYLVIPYGFPFTYFLGMAVGWVISLMIMYTFVPRPRK